MKSIVTLVILFTSCTLFSQDRILKTDGTIIKGKVISFQNNRLVVQQEDETEITLPKKAIAEIKFDYQDNAIVTAKSVEATETTTPTPVSAPASYSTVPPVRDSKPIIVEKAPEAPKVTMTKSTVESAGSLTGFGDRILMAAPALKERPIGVGRIAVSVCLNADGSVAKAKFSPVGSSTMDADLISLAVQNARTYKFTQGTREDCGVITYKFNMD
jgi:hypothetical protein